MPAPSTTAVPLSLPSGKKRRPNFRPTSQRSKTIKAAAPAATATTTPAEADAAPPQEEQVPIVAVGKPLSETPTAQDVSNAKETAVSAEHTPVEKAADSTAAAAAAPSKQQQQQALPPRGNPPVKRTRKRKTIGVGIGVSRLALNHESSVSGDARQDAAVPGTAAAAAISTTSNTAPTALQSPSAANNQNIAAGDAQTIPEDTTSGQPRLLSYCSKFRSKRKKKEKTAAMPEIAAMPVAEETTTVSAGPVVQIINGEIVLQESSMVVEGSGKPDEEFTVVEEDSQLAVVGASYNSFVSRRAPQHWSVPETQLFYEALRQIGTDFGTMEAYFGKKRTRKQLKRKYQIESTKNPQLVEMALDPSAQKEIDLSVFKVTVDTSKKTTSATTTTAAAATTSQAASAPLATTETADDYTAEVQPIEPPTLPPMEAVPAPPAAEPALAVVDQPNAIVNMEPFWPVQEEELAELGDDPLLQEEQAAKGATASISLVPNKAGATKAKSKRPKFRLRKAKK